MLSSVECPAASPRMEKPFRREAQWDAAVCVLRSGSVRKLSSQERPPLSAPPETALKNQLISSTGISLQAMKHRIPVDDHGTSIGAFQD